MKILIVEDDSGISDFIIPELQHEGFTTCLAVTGREALEKFKSENPDLVLLDIMLPELNGLEVLRRIRSESMVPVILETARGETVDKINGLNLGADDYIPKPFEIEELLARINALMRRVNFSKGAVEKLSYKNLSLDANRMGCLIQHGKDKEEKTEIQLSKTEFMLIKLLLENQGKVFTRQMLLDRLWAEDLEVEDRIVDSHIKNIRKKLNADYIKTIRGVGYRIDKVH